MLPPFGVLQFFPNLMSAILLDSFACFPVFDRPYDILVIIIETGKKTKTTQNIHLCGHLISFFLGDSFVESVKHTHTHTHTCIYSKYSENWVLKAILHNNQFDLPLRKKVF